MEKNVINTCSQIVLGDAFLRMFARRKKNCLFVGINNNGLNEYAINKCLPINQIISQFSMLVRANSRDFSLRQMLPALGSNNKWMKAKRVAKKNYKVATKFHFHRLLANERRKTCCTWIRHIVIGGPLFELNESSFVVHLIRLPAFYYVSVVSLVGQ